MKRYSILLITAAAVLLSGCGGNQSVTQSNISSAPESSTESSAKVSEKSKEVSEEITESSLEESSELSQVSKEQNSKEKTEPVFITNDPNEFSKYPGQWECLDSNNCIIEISHIKDNDYDIFISDAHDGIQIAYKLKGTYIQSEGGIHYKGSMKQTEGNRTSNSVRCDGYLRRGQNGYLYWENLTEYYGNGYVFRRLDA